MAIKVFTSEQQGAPTLNGVNGSLITVLDAILVNGYGSVSVTSITRSGTTATATTGSAHGLSTGDTALIAGAAETDYNGEFVVTVTDGTHFTYTVANSPSTPATGTITSKRAPAGFTKSFSGTNKAVYRSNDVSGIRHYFRFIDDGTTAGGAREARMIGYETMSDVDTGTGPFPTAAFMANGYFCQKSDTADSSARAWICITDGKTVYFQTCLGVSVIANASNVFIFAFGDIIPFKPGDAYASFCSGGPTANSFASPPNNFCQITQTLSVSTTSGGHGLSLPRNFTAVAGPVVAQLMGNVLNTTCIGQSVLITYPHQPDNGFYMVPALVAQGSPNVFRGRMPGLYEPYHARCFNNGDIIDNVQGFSGRKFMMVYAKAGSSTGAMVIDITGPWGE